MVWLLVWLTQEKFTHLLSWHGNWTDQHARALFGHVKAILQMLDPSNRVRYSYRHGGDECSFKIHMNPRPPISLWLKEEEFARLVFDHGRNMLWSKVLQLWRSVYTLHSDLQEEYIQQTYTEEAKICFCLQLL